MKEENIIHAKMKYRLEDYSGPSLGGGDDYSTYNYLNWDSSKKRWISHSGGTDGSTYESYSPEIIWEDYTPSVVEEYIKEELDKIGIKVNLNLFKPLCKHNLETILEIVAKTKKVTYEFELLDGRKIILEG